MSIYIGIDPGLTGAVGVVDDKGQFVAVVDAPIVIVKKGKGKRSNYVDSEMVRIIKDAVNNAGGGVVLTGMELLHAMREGTSSNFSCGLGSGLWRGIVVALGLPLTLITPQAWKKAVGVAIGSDKGQSIIIAKRLFPAAPITLKKHDGRAEALLIAEALRRSYQK